MTRRPVVVIGGIAIASISIAIFSYYLFMPVWLLVERIESTEHDVIELPDSDLAASPELKEALKTADERFNPGLPGTNSFKLTNSDGNKILEILREKDVSADSSNRFRIENGGKYYLVSVIFQYEPPGLA